jgi:hypothetical protein
MPQWLYNCQEKYYSGRAALQRPDRGAERSRREQHENAGEQAPEKWVEQPVSDFVS